MEAGGQTRDALAELRASLRQFAADRDWDQYHSPKNLASALVVEASELLEHFQWLSEEASMNLAADNLSRAADELADVLLYLVRLADKLNVDLMDAATQKIAKNAERYPIEKARGTSRKYTEL